MIYNEQLIADQGHNGQHLRQQDNNLLGFELGGIRATLEPRWIIECNGLFRESRIHRHGHLSTGHCCYFSAESYYLADTSGAIWQIDDWGK